MGLKERSGDSDLSNPKTFNTLEAPIILGVGVVGLLVGCALYHMCYRKLCMSRRPRGIFYSRNRGPSAAEIRTRRTMVSEIFQHDQLEGEILSLLYCFVCDTFFTACANNTRWQKSSHTIVYQRDVLFTLCFMRFMTDCLPLKTGEIYF